MKACLRPAPLARSKILVILALLIVAGCRNPTSTPNADLDRLLSAIPTSSTIVNTTIIAPHQVTRSSLEQEPQATTTQTSQPKVTLSAVSDSLSGRATIATVEDVDRKVDSRTSVTAHTSAELPSITSESARNSACTQPIEDYARVEVNDENISVRTKDMLETAQSLYGGPGDMLRLAQGSFTDDVSGSFGTHAGGGAVDISIRDPREPEIRLYEEVDAMVRALRLAGFAAWYRAHDEVFAGSVPHIHAIAIGDRDLSPAAQDQLNGPAGYFRGLNGLPFTPPGTDKHGGPVICQWMAEIGYRDLRGD